jgi:hypothetical protein
MNPFRWFRELPNARQMAFILLAVVVAWWALSQVPT